MDRLTVEIDDLDEAAAMMRRQYSLRIDSPRAGMRSGLRSVTDSLGGLTLTQMRWAMDFSCTAYEPMPDTYISYIRRGLVTSQIGGEEHRWTPGDVFVAGAAGSTVTSTVLDFDHDFALIDNDSLQAVAQAADDSPVVITGYGPVSVRAAEQWKATLEFAHQVASQPEVSPLVCGATARLLAATALATFPNNACVEPTTQDRRDAHPETLRRAIAFIESRLDEDLRLPDIAAACSVTARALQLAFRRHLDSTPMAYVRDARLDQVRRALQAATPTDGHTVTSIAARWGFGDPSRFSQQYQRAFGELPSHTLHR